MVSGSAIRAALVGLSLVLSSAAQSASPGSAPDFQFTDPDFELLNQANQLDRFLWEKGQVLDDSGSNTLLAKTGGRLNGSLPAPERVTWSYHVLRDPLPNAFAFPNGSIYVNSGLIGLVRNEDQLASVLAHEREHVLGRHAYFEYRSYRKKMVGIHVFEAIASGGYLAGGVPATAIALAASVAPFFVAYSIFGYSRELERAADLRGMTALTAAGYDGRQMVDALRLLDSGYEVHLAKEPAFYADHPKLEDRIAYLSEVVKSAVDPVKHSSEVEQSYVDATHAVVCQDVSLQIRAGRPRSAVGEADRLVQFQPPSAENSYLQGEAWRALGPRTPQPQPQELTEKGIEHTRKLVKSLTLQEYEARLLSEPSGAVRLEASNTRAEAAYRQAIAQDPACARCYRGLGFLYESMGRSPDAIQSFSKYLALAPTALDRAQILHRVQILQSSPAAPSALSGKD